MPMCMPISMVTALTHFKGHTCFLFLDYYKKFAQLDNCGLTVYTHWYAGGGPDNITRSINIADSGKWKFVD